MKITKSIHLALLAVLLAPLAANAVPITTTVTGDGNSGDNNSATVAFDVQFGTPPSSQCPSNDICIESFSIDLRAGANETNAYGSNATFDTQSGITGNSSNYDFAFSANASVLTVSGWGAGQWDPGNSLQFSLNVTNLGDNSGGAFGRGNNREVGITFLLENGNSLNGIFSKNNSRKSTAVVDTTSVPEPSTLALLGLGLVGMAVRRRKKV